MREILFRGKRLDNGKWQCGCLLLYGKRCFIIPSEELIESEVESRFYWRLLEKHYEVDPETVGQFTGLTDKNGKEIFEGDIVDIMHQGIYQCRWDDGNFEFGFSDGTESFGVAYISPNDIFVIGNIHDNPELLEEG